DNQSALDALQKSVAADLDLLRGRLDELPRNERWNEIDALFQELAAIGLAEEGLFALRKQGLWLSATDSRGAQIKSTLGQQRVRVGELQAGLLDLLAPIVEGANVAVVEGSSEATETATRTVGE